MAASGGKADVKQIPEYPILRICCPAHWCCGCWQPIAVCAALQALFVDVTLAVKSEGKDRANGDAGR
jgi:hypothetical protein